jgi:hypothetical protein
MLRLLLPLLPKLLLQWLLIPQHRLQASELGEALWQPGPRQQAAACHWMGWYCAFLEQ